MLVYCAGLGLPFVLAAVATEHFTKVARFLRRHAVLFGRVGGVLLIVIGVAEVTGLWHQWVLWLQVHALVGVHRSRHS
jgi:cytochrome c-type biogenesis protein